MDPKNNDPLIPEDLPSDSTSSSGQKHPEDRKPHWDELGRGTTAIPKGAAEILKSYFDNQQINQAGEYHSFFSSWRDLAGLDLASHSSPRDIRNNTLIIDADHPGWVQMIYMKKKAILKKIRSRFPLLDINDLRVLYTSHHGPSRPDSSGYVTTMNTPDSPGVSPYRKTEASTEKYIEDEHPEAEPFTQGSQSDFRLLPITGRKKTSDRLPDRQTQPKKKEREENHPAASEDELAEGDRLREALEKLGKHFDK